MACYAHVFLDHQTDGSDGTDKSLNNAQDHLFECDGTLNSLNMLRIYGQTRTRKHLGVQS